MTTAARQEPVRQRLLFVLGRAALAWALAARATAQATVGDSGPPSPSQPGFEFALGLTSMSGTNASLAGAFELNLNQGNDHFSVQIETDLHYVVDTGQAQTVSQDEELDWNVQLAVGHNWTLGVDGKIERTSPDGPALRVDAGPSVRRTWSRASGSMWIVGASVRREVQDSDTEDSRSWSTLFVPEGILRYPVGKQLMLVEDLQLFFSVTETSRYRLDNEIILDLMISRPLSIEFDVDFEYDSHPEPGWDHSNILSSVKLKYSR